MKIKLMKLILLIIMKTNPKKMKKKKKKENLDNRDKENINNNNNEINKEIKKDDNEDFIENNIKINQKKNNNNDIDNINKNYKEALHYCEVLYYDNNNQIDIYHLILANEDSEAGEFYNKYAYSFIKNRYDDYIDLKSFDIFEEIKNVFTDIAPFILSKKINDITFNDNQDIINRKLIQLKSKEELVLALNDSFMDNSLSKINGFQPKYNYFKPDDKTLEIRLEIPGNCNCNAKKSIVKDKVIITFYGKKNRDKLPEKTEDNLFSSREYSDFELNVPFPIEEFEITSNVKKQDKKHGIHIFQFELAPKTDEISQDVDDV